MKPVLNTVDKERKEREKLSKLYSNPYETTSTYTYYGGTTTSNYIYYTYRNSNSTDGGTHT